MWTKIFKLPQPQKDEVMKVPIFFIICKKYETISATLGQWFAGIVAFVKNEKMWLLVSLSDPVGFDFCFEHNYGFKIMLAPKAQKKKEKKGEKKQQDLL